MIEIYLRDYLCPGGNRPYSALAADLEVALETGQRTVLISVPGFVIANGTTEYESLPPWSDSDGNYYRTAKDCLDRKNPVEI